MKNVLNIIKTDFKLLFSNFISIVVVIGLVIVPGMYVWFNLAGVWDPYNSVDNLEVAVVNEDEGYKSEILPVDLKLGNSVVSALRENKEGFKWQFTDYDDAMNNLHNGSYYAAIVIPENFSNQLLSIIGGTAKAADLIYYSNEKINPLSPKITGTGATKIQDKINTTMSKTIYSVLLKSASTFMNSGEQAGSGAFGDTLLGILWSSTDSINHINSNITILRSEVNELKDTIDRIRKEIPESGTPVITKIHQALDKAYDEVHSAKSSVQEVKDFLSKYGLQVDVVDRLYELVCGLEESINQCHKIVDESEASANSLVETLNKLSDLLDNIDFQMGSLSETFTLITQDLDAVRNRMSSIMSSNTTDEIKDIIGDDTDSFASLISTPIVMDRQPVFHMENNAASMSGFYISICIWVGALILAAMLKAELTKNREKDEQLKDLKNWQIYLGRYAVFGVISLLQTLFIVVGCVFFLQVPVLYPGLFIITSCLISICYSLFIYTMLASFGSLGKALCVILLVLQIAASGGTFPIPLIAYPFTEIANFLPTTYSLRAINMCVAGFTGSDLQFNIMLLCSIMIPLSLLFGLVLRNPIIKLNEKFHEKVSKANLLAI